MDKVTVIKMVILFVCFTIAGYMIQKGYDPFSWD